MVHLFEGIRDMWLHNWEQLNMTGNWEWMIESEDKPTTKRKRLNGISKKLFPIKRLVPPSFEIEALYFKIHDEFSDLTGDNSKLEEWSSLIVLRMEARVLYAEGDESQMNWINKFDDMIKGLMKSGETVDLIKARLIYAQQYGMPINPKKTTVYDFIQIMKIVDAQVKQKNAKNVA